MIDGGPRLVLHVGAVPTASWRVHRCLWLHRAALRGSGVGILDTAALNRTVGSGDALRADPDGLRAVVDAAAAAEPEVLVGSHEGLVGPPFGGAGLFPAAGEVLAALDSATRGRPRAVVVSVCPQQEFLEAFYARLVTARRTHEPFATWLAGIDLDALSWRPLLDALTATFGPDVTVVPYADIENDAEEFLRTVLAAAGVRLTAAEIRTAVPAPGLSHQGLEMLRRAAPLVANAGEWQALRDLVGRHFSLLDHPRPRLLTDEQRAALQQRYGDEVAAVEVVR
jgi:hypothetical protein